MSELDKTAISWGRLRIAQSRKGRRPMSVETFLRKEKDGSLYKASALFSKEKRLERKLKRGLKSVERAADSTLGMKVRNLLQRRTLGQEVMGKVQNELGSLGVKLGAEHEDQIPGGFADDAEPEDFPPKQLAKGVKVEREHTDDDSLAKEIAMDHLEEFPDYYTALDKMEEELEAKKEAGVLQRIGEVLTAPIPGTPRLLMGEADEALKTTGKRALQSVRAKPSVTRGSVTSVNPRDYGFSDDDFARLASAKVAEVGPMENKLPWYTTAGMGTAGAMAGSHLVPAKYKTLGAIGGTLLGTGVGLEGGTAIGRELDQRKLRKVANSGGTMQRMQGEGASRGIDHFILEDPEISGRPATSKNKPGDSPTRDEAPEYRSHGVESRLGSQSLDLAPKVATISADENEFPTREDGPEQDPASSRRVEMYGYQHSSDTPVPGYNPDWKKKAHVQRAMRDELQKLCCVREEQLVKHADLLAEEAGPAGSYEQALHAAEKLKELEEKRPTLAQLGRGATAGAIVGTGSTLANKLVSGDLVKTYAKALGEAAPGVKGKLLGLGKGTLDLGRSMAGGAAGSAVFGAALPLVGGEINRRAEMARLRDYVEENPRSRLRKAVSQYTGV
jgi:hypothetical protein